jgi:hypothetical protein
MEYRPKPIPQIQNVDELVKYLDDELRMISVAMTEFNVLQLAPLGKEPKKLQDGMVVYANGTGWNPGSGAGAYLRRGGAWVPLWT